MFFKKTIAGIAALTTVASMSGLTAFAAEETDAAKSTGFKADKINTIVYSTDNVKTIDCRYYDSLPSIPYIKVTDYYKTWTDQDMTVKNNNDGTFELKVPAGVTASLDVNKDTLHTDDYDYFFTPEDEANATSPFTDLYVKQKTNEHKAKAYDFNFGKYNIDIIADNDDIWVPVPTLCDVFVSDLKNPYFMDDTLIFSGDLQSALSPLLNAQSEAHIKALNEKFSKNGRPQDLADYTYNELCFAFDTTYGFPGRPYFTDLIKEKGLDGMLSEGNDTTKKIKELLKSTDLTEYSVGFELLNYYLWDGGHTQFAAVTGLVEGVREKSQELVPTLGLTFENGINYMADLTLKTSTSEAAHAARAEMVKGADYVEEIQGTEQNAGSIYCEKGDVAFFAFDSFTTDRNAWDEYYHRNGELPVEVVSSFYKSLLRADQNPKIKKFVIDMGANGGGDSSVLAYLMSLITDADSIDFYNSKFDVYDEIKGDVDKNFDKVIDDKDKDFKTDLKFGVIASNTSFSCGNLFPSMAHDNGIMLIGEQSGGGSCAIQIRMAADGNFCVLSSGLCLVDKNKKSIDLGIKPDYETVKLNDDGSKDFSATYNFDNLSKYFDEFYKMTPANNETTTTTTTAAADTTTTTTTAAETTTTSSESTAKPTESTTTVTSTDAATTTTVKAEENKTFAPVSEMGSIAMADYKAKNGIAPADSVTKDNGDGTYSIIMKDDKGNVLDTYTIDPATGKGKDSKGNDVELPQTGNNSMKTAAAAAVAVTFMAVGAAAVIGSGVGRKKKDNE